MNPERPPHWMGEHDYERDNAEHERILQAEWEEAQEEAARERAEKFNEEYGPSN